MIKRLAILLILSILMIATQVNASSLCNFPNYSLRVRIYNYSSYDCILKNHYFIHGPLNNEIVVPKVIFRGFSEQFDMPITSKYVGNVLSFECGQDQEISLYSVRFYNSDTIVRATDSEVLNQQHLQASAEYAREDCDSWVGVINYNTVIWTIRDKD